MTATPQIREEIQPDSAAPAPTSVRDATIQVGSEPVSDLEQTLHSARIPQHTEDESVPGLTRDPFSSDAPLESERGEAERSGPRAAIAPHSADSSGARISMSAMQADEMLEHPLVPEPSSSTAPSTPSRAVLVEPARRSSSSTGKLLTAGAAIAVMAAVGTFLFSSSKRVEATTSAASAPAPAPEPAAPPPREPVRSAAPVASVAPVQSAVSPPVEPATLSIICKPQCVQVKVDDDPIGPTPVLNREIPAGKHRISLQLAGQAPTFIELELKPGEHVSRTFSLGPVAAPAPVATPAPAQPIDDPYEPTPPPPGGVLPP
jgi:hypothetical protein